jgi:WD40 repeat protein
LYYDILGGYILNFEGQIIELSKDDASPLSWSTKSQLAIGRANGAIEILEPDGELTEIGRHTKPIATLAWNREGTILAAASREYLIILWEGEDRIATLKGHKRPIYQLKWNPYSNLLSSCSGDKSVILWRDNEKLVDLVGHKGSVTSLSWRSDGGLLASGSADMTIRIWTNEGRNQSILEGHTKALGRVKWHPKENDLLASSSYDKTVRLWQAGSEYRVLEGHKDRVFGLAWNNQGDVLASASGFKDGIIKLWKKSGEEHATLAGHTSSVYQLAWQPKGNILASCSYDKTVRLWRNEEEYSIQEGHPGPIFSIAWSPDGKILVSSGQGAIGIWHIQ